MCEVLIVFCAKGPSEEASGLNHFKKHIGKQVSHISKCHLLQKVFKLQVLWSFHQFIKQRFVNAI